MAIDFPTSPTLNQTYTFGSRTWQWNGSAWDSVGVTLQGTAPIVNSSGTFSLTYTSGGGLTTVANGISVDSTVVRTSSPTITTPTIDTINTSFTTTGTAALWNTGITTGTISIGAALTTGTVNLATGGTGATSINIGHTNALIGLTGNTTVTGTLTVTGNLDTNLTTAGVVTTNASGVLSSSASLGVANGGTGTTATPTNGQLHIGNGTNFTLATLTQGTGMTITNAAGSITIANAGVTSVNGSTGAITGIMTNPLTTTGDTIYSSSGTTAARLAIGTAGQALVVNAGATAPAWTTLTLENLPGAWVKKSVRCATTAALGGTYANGTAGVGATLTITSTTILDGVTLVNGDRILVKDQATPLQNGIYIRTSATVLTRAVDADSPGELAGACVAIDEGTANGGLSYDCDFKATDTIGTTSVTWNRMLDTGYTIPVSQGGTGLIGTPTNGQLLIGNGTGFTLATLTQGTGMTITNGSGTISIANAGVTTFAGGTTGLTPAAATSGAITLAGTLVTANGGTGLTTFTAANNAIYSTSASALTAGTLPVLAGGTGVTTSTGSGANVLGTSPTLATPVLTLETTGAVTDSRISWDTTNKKLRVGNGTIQLDFASSTLYNGVAPTAKTGNYTLVLGDKDGVIEMNVATANTVTLPLNSSVAYPIGTQIMIIQIGAGQTSIAVTAGVTLNCTPQTTANTAKLRAQWSTLTLIKRGTDVWLAAGDLVA